MINYMEKGLGLFVEIERRGHWLRQIDGVFVSSNDEIVQTIIDEYDPLPEARAKRIAELSEQCGAAIVGGFTSSALGSVHHYDGGIEDQVNIMGAAMAGVDLPFRCRDDVLREKIFRPHTAAQMAQVYADGVAFKLQQLARLETLRAAVNNASTLEEVYSVVW